MLSTTYSAKRKNMNDVQLMNKRDVQLILKQLNIRPKKSLGQNFLIDKNIAKKIIKESELSDNDVILEIGPGLGVLTELLVEKVNKIYAVA